MRKCGISNKGKVFARKCIVKEVNKSEYDKFYKNNHIQGTINGCKHFGLYFEEELVACIGFKEVRSKVFDLTRYATSKNVAGGFSKLLSNFKKNVEWEEIFTYANLDYSDGALYELTGFERSGITYPNYHYFKNGIRYSRQQFMKHKLEHKLELFDESLTEYQNMRNNKYRKIYDSGSIKYKMVNVKKEP